LLNCCCCCYYYHLACATSNRASNLDFGTIGFFVANLGILFGFSLDPVASFVFFPLEHELGIVSATRFLVIVVVVFVFVIVGALATRLRAGIRNFLAEGLFLAEFSGSLGNPRAVFIRFALEEERFLVFTIGAFFVVFVFIFFILVFILIVFVFVVFVFVVFVFVLVFFILAFILIVFVFFVIIFVVVVVVVISVSVFIFIVVFFIFFIFVVVFIVIVVLIVVIFIFIFFVLTFIVFFIVIVIFVFVFIVIFVFIFVFIVFFVLVFVWVLVSAATVVVAGLSIILNLPAHGVVFRNIFVKCGWGVLIATPVVRGHALFVCIPALFQVFVRCDEATEIATVHNLSFGHVVPPAAATEAAIVLAIPMVSDPPVEGVIAVGPVAMPGLIVTGVVEAFGGVAVSEIHVGPEVDVGPLGFLKDATEPSLSAAVDGAL